MFREASDAVLLAYMFAELREFILKTSAAISINCRTSNQSSLLSHVL